MRTTSETPAEHALRTFRTDCADLQMEVRLDQGLYRHLSFRSPGTGLYWYDLITAPGQLTYRGDFGVWTWARTEDMFEFFRRRDTESINPGYWSQKLVADDVHTHHRNFSPDKFRAEVFQQFWDRREQVGSDAAEVWEAIRSAYEFRHKGFEFWGPEDWDVKEYAHQYLVALHGIVDGIARYDAAKAEAHAAEPIAA